ncbi:PREDICTED: auxin response factor 20-like [Brassica oleracea var. oleracea]|uniref:auxin response factor 20-like n=1 Tax=Brassica oleracea var. oleracea TaxID=109376 RepID=UPI0006A6B3DF|nr:PREDICTED: auxin response factor 20-like [Brassica oleracea var. oleracea]
MASDQIMHVQPESLATDGTNNYLYNQLWKLCAGPLFHLPKVGEKINYFPQGHIEQLVTSMNDELCQLKPIFDIPSKICCNVFSIKLKVETTTDEIYAEISLLPDTSEVEIPTPKPENNIQNINYFTKVLSASDTNKKGSFVLNKRHAIECLPLLLTPSQEVIAKDIHGHEWNFKHTLRGTPQRHLFTSGWNEFAKGKDLVVGDCFVFLRGENGESRVGIRKSAHHQQHNIPSPVISKQSMHHGVVATALNAIERKCMFVVFYKPRSSQFLVNFEKFIDGVNRKFSVGSRFLMKFEGRDFSEIRYYGTIVGVKDFSTHWKNSEWRSLEVQWDEAAIISRPDKVSPWEIEPLTHSSNIPKSVFLKNKRQSEINDFGQEIGQTSIQSSMSYSFPSMSKPNYNEQMVQAMKETSTTTEAASYRLFGVDLTFPAKTKDPVQPTHSYKKSKISKIFEEEKVDQIQTKTHTKVCMEGAAERTMDLTIFDGYNQLIDELERLFDIKDKLHMHNQWKIVFINADGNMMLLGDDPWPKFCNTAKEIFIYSEHDAKRGNADNKFAEGDPRLATTILPPDVNNN